MQMIIRKPFLLYIVHKRSVIKMKKWIIIGFISISLICIIAVGIIYSNATRPIVEKEETFIQMAKEQSNVVNIDKVDWFHYIDSYFVVKGTNHKGEKVIVWINEETEQLYTELAQKGKTEEEIMDALNQNLIDGLSSQDVPKEYIHVKLGMYETSPIWEVTYIDQRNRYTFLYLDFYTGKLFRKYNL